MLFRLGTVDITSEAAAALAAAGVDPSAYLERHQHGDWGDADEEDRQHNAFALRYGHQLESI